MIIKILKIMGIFLVAMGLGFAVMYFDLIKPPDVVERIPVVGPLLAEKNRTDEVEPEKQGETQRQKDKRILEEMKAQVALANSISSKLENENVELLAEIAALSKELDTLESARAESDSEADRLKKLAGYYGNMKAKNAAAIMTELDDATIIKIFSKMEMNATAGILGELNPQQAARITQKMAAEKGGE
ncbi:MAG: hypothetical protein GXY50_07240 [Syntrophomonadaceae bacterium]|nr:hypothetical protein [Syntrophomonadaceae bacterium]